MKLILLQDVKGSRLDICDAPPSIFTSRSAMSLFLRTHATRIFGGSEGRNWRVCCTNPQGIAPLTVNQLIPGTNGQTDYGQQLVIE